MYIEYVGTLNGRKGFPNIAECFLDGPNLPEQCNHGTYCLESRQTQKVRECMCQDVKH
jgi:hypothetical protein